VEGVLLYSACVGVRGRARKRGQVSRGGSKPGNSGVCTTSLLCR
jgi:hypothetical protein